ncbi:uncharacterized protein LOC114538349 [Dendronephthya gigantea]|uniref:uncharacterized protein LOC114538349 n=1 Tax=Dendronephthya gigantea TaxID=151771 RepID=UPI00106D2DBD|nr:uncharacterized protein LOC114538349 [Dendronephthya gigantea]
MLFKEKWNFDNCLGALDGKHVVIKPPPSSGSYYFNYKHTFSIVLLALVDADYKFTYIDIGTNGRISDGGVFRNSALAQALQYGELNLPDPAPLPNRTMKVPYVIVADDAFPLSQNIMKPFALRSLTKDQRIFNYRLSRARRIVENAFGILANRFRIFMKPIELSTHNVENIVMAACSLHNFLRSKSEGQNVYTPLGLVDIEDQDTHEIFPGQWRLQPTPEGLIPLAHQGSNRCTDSATKIRQEFCDYFNSADGEVPWQWNKL